MKGTIVNFRSSVHTQKDSHMIVTCPEIDSREKAIGMVGKDVEFKTQAGKTIKGRVAAPHGNKGALRVIFETGMPGQSLSQQVDIL